MREVLLLPPLQVKYLAVPMRMRKQIVTMKKRILVKGAYSIRCLLMMMSRNYFLTRQVNLCDPRSVATRGDKLTDAFIDDHPDASLDLFLRLANWSDGVSREKYQQLRHILTACGINLPSMRKREARLRGITGIQPRL